MDSAFPSAKGIGARTHHGNFTSVSMRFAISLDTKTNLVPSARVLPPISLGLVEKRFRRRTGHPGRDRAEARNNLAISKPNGSIPYLPNETASGRLSKTRQRAELAACA